MTPYYTNGLATIFMGDCREILPTLDADSIDLVLTDPPYGIRLENHGRKDGKRRDADWTIAGDDTTELGQGIVDYCRARWPIAAFASPRRPWAGEWRSLLVWHKPGVGVGGDPFKCWMQDWELIQVANNGKLTGKKESGVIRWPTSSHAYSVHPCAKPVGLCEKLITKMGGTGTVLDPFMGAGATLIAAQQIGRGAIGIEVEERHCETASRRLDQTQMGVFRP